MKNVNLPWALLRRQWQRTQEPWLKARGDLGPAPSMHDCVDLNHFQITADGALTPQPWMQWRQVASVYTPSRTGAYSPTQSTTSIDILGTLEGLFGSLVNNLLSIFGLASILTQLIPQAAILSTFGNKNDLLHDIQTSWTNDSPIDQWVYGKITRGGGRVTLQARSRGGLYLSSGYQESTSDAGAMMETSMLGCGADLGRGGTLSIGTTFGMIEERANSRTIPLAPERATWHRLVPGATLTARVQLRFISEFWENTTIDGGDAGTESSYETGATRLDLFAIPAID